MPFQADNSLRADLCIVDNACGQIETVTCIQGQLLPQFRQPKRDTSLHNIDDFVVGM